MEGRAARGEGRGDLRGRPARHPPAARSRRPSRTTSRSSSWPRPGSSASCSCSARSGRAATAAVCAVRRVEEESARLRPRSRSALGAYVLHALVDIDWEFVAVTAPAFFVLGGADRPRRAAPGAGSRGRSGARRRGGRPRRALFARRALLVGAPRGLRLLAARLGTGRRRRSRTPAPPTRSTRSRPTRCYALGDAEAARHDEEAALRYYRQAVDLQPENSSTWYALGSYEFFTGRYKEALHDLDRAYGLDRYGPAGRPGGLLDQARAKVLAGG